MPKWFPKWAPATGYATTFPGSFFGSGFLGCQGPPRDPKLTILAPKMDPQSSQNDDQETPGDTENATQATDA